MASPKNVVSKSIFGLVTVNKYHNESVCGRLSDRKPYSHFTLLLSGVARSGKIPGVWIQWNGMVEWNDDKLIGSPSYNDHL